MPELSEVLERLGLLQYLGRLNDEGFDKWETVLDITEQDLAALNFKLGHRRILQREIASARGIAATQALTPAQFGGPADECDQEEKTPVKASSRSDQGKGQAPTTTGKRKYRRHPKSDENAPDKPPSAYVMFANSVRDELKGQNLSFTEIAQLVGQRWKVLDPEKKEMYEYEASAAKDKFNAEFEEYKKTENYAQYVKYLNDFKSKLAKDGKETAEQTDPNTKRLKLESAPNTASQGAPSASASGGSPVSVGSVGIGGGPSSMAIGKVGGVMSGAQNAYASSPSRRASTSPKQPRTLPAMSTGSPLSPRKTGIDFAGYRDALARTTQQQQQEVQHVTTGGDPDSHFFPRIHHPVPNPHIQQQSSYMRHQPPSAPTPPGGRAVVLPSPGLRRRPDDGFSPLSSISGSSGSSSAPAITPITPVMSGIDENTRSHRALPPLPSQSTASGYFDQRTHHQRQPSQPPRSPRSSYQPQLPLPTIEHHSRTYSPSTALPTPQSTSLPLPPPPPLSGPSPERPHHRPD